MYSSHFALEDGKQFIRYSSPPMLFCYLCANHTNSTMLADDDSTHRKDQINVTLMQMLPMMPEGMGDAFTICSIV